VVGACWCTTGYFSSTINGVTTGYVVTGGGFQPRLYPLAASSTFGIATSKTYLYATQFGTSQDGGLDAGMMTGVSSNGQSNSILWVLQRPNGSTATNGPINLYAFSTAPPVKSRALTQLFPTSSTVGGGLAGTWNELSGGYWGQPVIANGQVFVASNKQLSIFSLPSQ
jgi:hypothetical protein